MAEGRRQKQTSSRQGQILVAALHLFTAGGEAAVTIEQVAAAAKASVGSIYHHFGSKEGILLALYRNALEEYRIELQQQVDAALDTRDFVQAIVRHHVHWIGSHLEAARLLHYGRRLSSVRAADTDIRQATGDFLAPFARRLRAAAVAGDIVRLPGFLLYAVLLGPALEVGRQWMSGGVPVERVDEVARHLAEAAWKAVSAGPGADPTDVADG